MTTYIAGPMTGLPEFNYPAFHAAAKDLRSKGIQVENPAENDGGSSGKTWDFYIRLALNQLLKCDAILLLPGWETSRGAVLELHVAEALGMNVIEYQPTYTPSGLEKFAADTTHNPETQPVQEELS